MNGKIVDTNVIIRYIKNADDLDDIFEEENLYFSSITLGELLFGAECSSRKIENANVYRGFCNELEEIKPDSFVTPFYAKIKTQLKQDGHPIPENDIWMHLRKSAMLNKFPICKRSKATYCRMCNGIQSDNRYS